MTLGLLHIGLGKIEAERGHPGPALFDEIEKAARPAANVEKTQPALVAPGEDLAERRQRLTRRVAGPLPARLLGQYFAVVAAFPAAADGGKILEEEPRAVE